MVGVRISVGEVTPAGLTEDEALEALPALDADGAMDYVSVVAGTSATLAGSDHIVPPTPLPNGYTAPLGGAGRRPPSACPVMVAGRITQPQEAEAILAAGQADTDGDDPGADLRPGAARPRPRAGRLDDIRACIGCNQACIGHFHAGFPISCIQFPESGREREFPRVGRAGLGAAPRAAAVARDVLVIGGGPAGLKAAAVAAERGHRVDARGGGPVGGRAGAAGPAAARPGGDGRRDHEPRGARPGGPASRSGPASAPTPTFVRASGAEVVVVATGAVPYRPPLELVGDPVVLDAWDVLRGAARPRGAGRRRGLALRLGGPGARDAARGGRAAGDARRRPGTPPGSGSSSTSGTR